MTDLNRKLRWLIALRLLIVFSIAGVYALSQTEVLSQMIVEKGLPVEDQLAVDEDTSDDDETLTNMLKALASIIAVVSIQTLLYLSILRFLRQASGTHAYIQFFGDVLLITFIMYRLGDGGQSFSLLYFVVISLASVLLRRSAGIVVATLAAFFYTVMIFGGSLGRVVFLAGWLTPHPSMSNQEPGTLWYSLLVHVAGFYAIAFMTSYLARDVTRAEERLRAKHLDLAYLEVVHRDIVQSISSGLVTTDLNGLVVSVNRSAEKIFDLRSHDLVGLHVNETGLCTSETWKELIECSTDGITRVEVERADRDDSKQTLSLTLSHLRDTERARRGYILVVEDLTEDRGLREQLRVKDRMAAIGEMAAGLAHEVGNPLAAISGSVQVLAHSFEGDSSQRKLLEITLKESRRLDRTVKSFLQLASSRPRRLTDVDIAALISEDIELLRNSDDVNNNHRIVADLVPPHAMIRADPDQIGQIFWNLARNALQAMRDGGELTVSGRLNDLTYRLMFHDTGSGMTEQERADLFHPFKSFFDQGTGIGMAIVYRIVEEHGGEIAADSRPGAGTAIRVDLPVAGPPHTDASAGVPVLAAGPPHGNPDPENAHQPLEEGTE